MIEFDQGKTIVSLLKRLLFVVCFVLSLYSIPSAANGFSPKIESDTSIPPAIKVQPDKRMIEVNANQVQFALSDNSSLGIEQVSSGALKFNRLKDSHLDFGLVKHDVWIKFELQTEGAQTKLERFLFLQPIIPYDISFYTSEANTRAKFEHHDLGFSKSISAREAPSVNYLVPITLQENQQKSVYIHIKSNGIGVAFALRIYQPSEYVTNQITDNFFVGILFGVIIAMILYNLFMYVSIRDLAYIYQALFGISLTIICLGLTGYGAYFLWPSSLDYNISIVGNAVVFAAFFGVLFTQNYTHRHHIFPAFDKILWLLLIAGVVIFCFMNFFPGLLVVPIIIYACIVTPVILVLALAGWVKRVNLAGFYFLAALVFLVAVVCYCLMVLNVLPNNVWLRYALLIGGAVEVFILTLGLSDVLNTELKEKHKQAIKQKETMLKLKEVEADMIYQAFHSELGLPNRVSMRRSFDLILEHNNEFSLLVFGISGFLQIQRTIGVASSKRLMAKLVHNIKKSINEIDFIVLDQNEQTFFADIDNSGFAFFIASSDQLVINEIIGSFTKALPNVFYENDLSINIDLRAGVAQYPNDSKDFDELLSYAQIALEYAELNHQKTTFYSENINSYQERRLAMLGDLRRAISDGKLLLYVQPKIDLHNGELIGGEVLLRWKHPEYGFIPPDEFITAAEKTGLIFSLTYWVISKTLDFIRELESRDLDLSIAVNISARCIMDAKFQKHSMKVIREDNFPIEKLIMEITETAFMDKAMQTAGVMKAFSDEGTVYSLDDFGTGYSSLAYLKQLPVSEIKIDQKFVRDLSSDESDQKIVQTMITMGHDLGLKVVAEGVEDLSALKILHELNCDVVQGFYIAKPMPIEDFFDWIKVYDPEKFKTDINA